MKLPIQSDFMEDMFALLKESNREPETKQLLVAFKSSIVEMAVRWLLDVWLCKRKQRPSFRSPMIVQQYHEFWPQFYGSFYESFEANLILF